MNEFYLLTPEKVLDSVESFGYRCTGRCLALNSLENRVYEVEIESESASSKFIIAKFYRPKRWSIEQIREEHSFLLELAAEDILVVPPISFNNETIYHLKDIDCYCALFPKFSGRMELESSIDSLERLGRLIARMHQVGMRKEFKFRPSVCPEWYLKHNLECVNEFIPPEVKQTYHDYLKVLEEKWEQSIKFPTLRLHGDCHRGNILWRPEEESLTPLLVDFDDSVQGPMIQDFWLLFSGRVHDFKDEFDAVIRGYEMFLDFDDRQLKSIELLRAFRMVQYAGWIARRWEDPSFRKVFPDITEDTYWKRHLLDLKEQIEWI